MLEIASTSPIDVKGPHLGYVAWSTCPLSRGPPAWLSKMVCCQSTEIAEQKRKLDNQDSKNFNSLNKSERSVG